MKDTYLNHRSIKCWAEDDRPREKLMHKGRTALSDAELIAILLGSGSRDKSAVELAREILQSSENNLHELGRQSLKNLMKFKGIGEAKAISVIAALELGRRRKETEPKKKAVITSSHAAYEILLPFLSDLNHEEFWVLCLSRANHVIAKHQMSKGGLSSTVVDPKIIFEKALSEQASALILAHNHPSGNLKASEADKRLTAKIKKGGELLDIQLLDHIILAGDSYLSFADEGLL